MHVALIIPTLNEAEHIGGLLSHLRASAPPEVVQIIVADGGSTDQTRAIVADAAKFDGRIVLIDNPRRLQSAGVNTAVAILPADVDVFIRIDAHAQYSVDFVAALIAEKVATGAESVVNQLNSVGSGCFQRAVAAASNSRFGTGGATHRVWGRPGYVDHGHHALFDRAAFERVGGYDESFFANEDAEFDARLRAAGGKVWFTDRATVGYFPRRTPAALARQYFRYGRGRAMTRAKHRERLRPRQLAPVFLVLLLFSSILLAPVFPLSLATPALYFAATSVAGALLAVQMRDRCALGAAIALPIMHLSWGLGFLLQAAGLAGHYLSRA